MKRPMMKAIGILLVAALVISGLPSRMPSTAEAKSPVGIDDRAGSNPGIEEAERARTLVLESWGLHQMQQLSAREGLRLRTDRQPLACLKEENGHRLYAAEKQAVSFLGEKEGHRIYQVFLGFEESPQGSERSSTEDVSLERSTDEVSLVLALVDVASEEVLDITRVDISDTDSDGARKILLRNPTGRQAEFLATKDGTLMSWTLDKGSTTKRRLLG